MLDRIDLDGEWWFPWKKEVVFNGKLTFSQEKGGSLVIYGPEDPFVIVDTSEKQESKETLILGKLSDGRNVTLQSKVKPNQESILRQYYSFSKRTFKIDYIFIGHHFQNVQDIIFKNVSVEYSNVEKWLAFVCKNENEITGRFASGPNKNKSGFDLNFYYGKPVEIEINDVSHVKIFSFPSIIVDFGTKTQVVHKIYVKFESYGHKDMNDYVRLKSKLQNFFNFITTHEVRVQRIVGEVSVKYKQYTSTEFVEILYRSSISSKMDKIMVISPNLPIYQVEEAVDLIQKWFSLSDKISAVYDLYFGVMYNYQLYLTSKFLMLAEALEIYGLIKFSEDSKKLKNHKLNEALKNVEDSNFPIDTKNWIKSIINQKKTPSFREGVSFIYEKYADLLPQLSKVVGSKDYFANIVTEYRNKLTHGNVSYDDLNNEEIFWKYKDIQLILQLCILSELGYSNNELKSLYLIDDKKNRAGRR